MTGIESRIDAVYGRVARVVGGVLRETLRRTESSAIVLLDAESPEGELVARIVRDAGIALAEYAGAESALTAHPANKTALLVGGFIPRVDLFPLGDLYASQIADLCGGEWTGDDAVQALALAEGGIAGLDAALLRHIDGREQRDLTDPETAVCDGILAALERTRFRRQRAGLVPKLGYRTIGVDLLD